MFTDPFGLCPPIEDCLRKANLVGMALILGNGGRPLSLGSRPEGTTQVIGGTNVIATRPTTFGLGLNPGSGNAAVGFQGGLQLDINNKPDPILDKGVLDLGTGQYEATGSLNNIAGIAKCRDGVRVWRNGRRRTFATFGAQARVGSTPTTRTLA